MSWKKREVSTMPWLEVVSAGKLEVANQKWGLRVTGEGCIFGFLQLDLSWKWGQKLGK